MARSKKDQSNAENQLIEQINEYVDVKQVICARQNTSKNTHMLVKKAFPLFWHIILKWKIYVQN